jgi:hypothetical protein
MSGPPREARGELVYRVLNRAAGQPRLFGTEITSEWCGVWSVSHPYAMAVVHGAE